MGRIKKFLVSFIPRYISNDIVLLVYQLLALVPVPKEIRKKNYKHNIEQLKNTEWDFWTDPHGCIENQSQWGNILFGKGAQNNIRYAGCEIIAAFNALKILTGTGTPESMARLISERERKGAALWGGFGVSPRAIEAYFRKQGFHVETTTKDDERSIKRVAASGKVFIATVYNDAGDITKQAHTVCISGGQDGGYVLHNAYRKNKNGKYASSVSYADLSTAIKHVSGADSKLIYLIGIAYSSN